jgi:hypothetical protein
MGGVFRVLGWDWSYEPDDAHGTYRASVFVVIAPSWSR